MPTIGDILATAGQVAVVLYAFVPLVLVIWFLTKGRRRIRWYAFSYLGSVLIVSALFLTMLTIYSAFGPNQDRVVITIGLALTATFSWVFVKLTLEVMRE